jgi:hypothetical protein
MSQTRSKSGACSQLHGPFERGGTCKSGISKDQLVELQHKIGGLQATAKPGLATAMVVWDESWGCFNVIFDTAGATGDEISIDFKSYGVINAEFEQHYKHCDLLIAVPSECIVTNWQVILTPDCILGRRV